MYFTNVLFPPYFCNVTYVYTVCKCLVNKNTASFTYSHRNKRKIMRIFTMPPTVGSAPEPNFYDSLQKVRLRQQLEMYSLCE